MAKKKASSKAPDWLTAGFVWGMYQARRDDGDERQLRVEINEMRELVGMKKKPRIPREYQAITQEIRTSFVKDAHEHVSGAMFQNDPVPHIEPSEDKDEFKRAAAIGERWTDAAFSEMSDTVGEDVAWEFCKNLVRDREAVIKLVHRPDAWANFPDRKPGETAADFLKRTTPYKKGSAFPAAWRVIDRKQMVFDDGEFGSNWAIEYGEYPRPYLMRDYDMVVGRDGKLIDPSTVLGGMPAAEGELQTSRGMAQKLEYFDQEWWHVVVDGNDAPGYPKPNPYAGGPNNGLPYFCASVSANPLIALRWLQPALDSLLTMHLNWAYLGAYPIPKITAQPNSLAPSLGLEGGVPGGEEEQPNAVEWKPGRAFFPPPGYDLTFVVPPPIGPDVSQMEERLRSLIDIAGIPSVLRGGAAADASGYLANQLISAAIMRFRSLIRALQRAFGLIGSFLWWIVSDKVQQEVFVLEQEQAETDRMGKPRGQSRRTSSTWLSLTPDGSVTATSAPVTHFAKFIYRMRPVLPTDEQARAMIALQVTNAPKPLYGRRRALEKFMQEEDPEGVLDEVYVENTLDNDPQIHQVVVENAMRKAGFPMPGQGNPANQLIDIQGRPLIPGGGQPMPSAYSPGPAAAGQASVPGLTQPLQPSAPGAGPAAGGRNSVGHSGGRPAGSYPGAPGNQGAA